MKDNFEVYFNKELEFLSFLQDISFFQRVC